MTQHIPEQPDTEFDTWLKQHNEEPTVYYPRVERAQRYAVAVIVALLIAAALLVGASALATSTVTGQWKVNFLRGTTTQECPTCVGATQEEAWAKCVALVPAPQPVTNQTSGQGTYRCQTPVYTAVVTYSPNPPPVSCPTPPAPQVEQRACPSGTTGTWMQTGTTTLGAPPACLATVTWAPTSPRPTDCPPIPPTCPAAPADRLNNCPSEYTGTWTQRGSVGPPPACTTTWEPLAFPPDACTPVTQPVTPPLFYDDFNYDLARTAATARTILLQHGWTHAKSLNSGDSGAWGYLYTQPDAARGSRVLVVESRAGDAPIPPGFGYGQTDFYAQLGRERGAIYIPPKAYFQFWTTATTDSRFSARDKFLYPCRVFYPCGSGQWSWLLMQGSRGFQTVSGAASDRFLAMQGETADYQAADEYPTNATKLFQNVDASPMRAGRWYQVRIHIDISGAQGVYQAWRRESTTQPWLLVADWRGGVYPPRFQWPVPAAQRGGHELLRIPTTSNGPGNSTFYLDDFAIGRSLNELTQ